MRQPNVKDHGSTTLMLSSKSRYIGIVGALFVLFSISSLNAAIAADESAAKTDEAAKTTDAETKEFAPPDPVLRGPLNGNDTNSNPPANPNGLLPADTVPLGVDQYMNQPGSNDGKGPEGEFLQLVKDLTFNKVCQGCTGIKVRIQNNGKSPIIVDGDHAQARPELASMSEEALMKQSGGQFSSKQIKTLALVGTATLMLAEPILQDHFSTSKTDFPVSYGVNETRRRLEDRRLARRIILPGENTEGIIFFKGSDIKVDKLSIPLLTYPQGQASGSLDISCKLDSSKTNALDSAAAVKKEKAHK
ncbi:MAG: hypothetical protein K2X27_09060 [Candidatus Obscuribacterales bacterium]|nr:hypothetical protein [Candidatus Obscuribacterales bacterium]